MSSARPTQPPPSRHLIVIKIKKAPLNSTAPEHSEYQQSWPSLPLHLQYCPSRPHTKR